MHHASCRIAVHPRGARSQYLWACAIAMLAYAPIHAQEADATGKLGIIGDSIASATHTTDVCGNRDIVECIREVGGQQSRDWSFAGGKQSWSIATRLGYPTDRVVDASDDGEEWKDALDQAVQVMADPALESVFISLGANDVCQSKGHDYGNDLQTVSAHIDATLTYLTDNLPQGGHIYWSGIPDLLKLRTLMRQRDHNVMFDSCQATWDVDGDHIKDGAVEDACEHYFSNQLCELTEYLGQARDALVEEAFDMFLDSAGVDEGPCGKILDSGSSAADRQEARRFNRDLNQLMARKAQEYSGRNGISIHYTDRIYHASVTAQPYHVSRLDCYHPSRAGQMWFAHQVWGGLNLGDQQDKDIFLDEFDSEDYCTQELTEWGSCWTEINEDCGPDACDIRIGEGRLRVQNKLKGIQRAAPLDRADQAWVSFNWRRKDLDRRADFVSIDVSPDGGQNWFEVARFAGDADEVGMHRGNVYDISPYASADTLIRFLGSAGLGDQDRVYFDNVQIHAWSETQDAATPPVLAEITVGTDWQPVALPTGDDPPVVFLGAPAPDSADAVGLARLRNVTDGLFEVKWQNATGSSPLAESAMVSYLAIRPGQYVTPDGTWWDIGSTTVVGGPDWQRVRFTGTFAAEPFVLTTVQSAATGEPLVAEIRAVTNSGFEMRLKAIDGTVPAPGITASVGYLAAQGSRASGYLRIGGVDTPFLLQNEALDGRWQPVVGHTLRATDPLAPASDAPETSFDVLAVAEHVFAQASTDTQTESVLVSRLAPEDEPGVDWGTVSGVQHNWVTVPLTKPFSRPVVVASLADQGGREPGVLRVRNVTPESFQVRFQEWDYLNGQHGDERIFYLVAEEGSSVFRGLSVEAGLTPTSANVNAPENVTFNATFGSTPAILATVMSSTDAPALTARIHAPVNSGFGLSLQAQESLRTALPQETVGWIAIEDAAGSSTGGKPIEVLTSRVNHNPVHIDFGAVYDRRFPVALGQIDSTLGRDPVTFGQQSLTAQGVEVFLQEEQSFDEELRHGREDVVVVVLE